MSLCLNCGHELSGAACVKETTSKRERKVMPKAGDLSICIKCGHLMGFDESLKLVELTPAQMIQVAGDRRLLVMQRARKMQQESDDAEGKKAATPKGDG